MSNLRDPVFTNKLPRNDMPSAQHYGLGATVDAPCATLSRYCWFRCVSSSMSHACTGRVLPFHRVVDISQEDILQNQGLGTSATFELTSVGLPDAEVGCVMSRVHS